MAALGAGMKSKILRRVGFPLVLDMYEFCDETLQAELTVVSDPLPPSTPPLVTIRTVPIRTCTSSATRPSRWSSPL
eukprot:5207710-Pyramimonas_sp.AAC.3